MSAHEVSPGVYRLFKVVAGEGRERWEDMFAYPSAAEAGARLDALLNGRAEGTATPAVRLDDTLKLAIANQGPLRVIRFFDGPNAGGL